MQSSTGKFQKLLTVIITWALLLGFFFLYESFFVTGQREFLIERHFRSLSALSNALSAEFDRARTSAESSLRLVASASKKHAQVESLLDCQDASNVQKCFESFTTIYLGDVLLTGKSPVTVPRCWGPDPDRIPLEMATDNGRPTLSVSCFSKENDKQPGNVDPSSRTVVFTLDMTPWLQRGLQRLGDPFDDVLLAEPSGRVLFQRSTTDPRIANLSPIVASSMELGPRQMIVTPPTAGNQDRSSAQDAEQEKPPATAAATVAAKSNRNPQASFKGWW